MEDRRKERREAERERVRKEGREDGKSNDPLLGDEPGATATADIGSLLVGDGDTAGSGDRPRKLDDKREEEREDGCVKELEEEGREDGRDDKREDEPEGGAVHSLSQLSGVTNDESSAGKSVAGGDSCHICACESLLEEITRDGGTG